MNSADLYQPIHAIRSGPAPVVINVITTPRSEEYAGGVLSSSTKNETYVLYSVLPEELRQRVKLAVETVMSSI